MNEEKLNAYRDLFEKMIDMMTDPENFDRDRFVDILKDICELFHIAKGVTEFYKSVGDENDGIGDVLIDFDNGRGEKVIIKRRLVTKAKAVVKGTIYAANEDTFTDEELKKIDIMLRALLSFISRNRMQKTLEQTMFYDPVGYRNVNYFMRHLDTLNEKGMIHGNTLVQINLRQFSIINREIGRDAGDVVMRKYYDRIEEIIGEDGVICRLGGDNFIMIFKTGLLDDILAIIKGYQVVYGTTEDKRVKVSAVAGVYIVPDDYVYERAGDLFELTYVAVQTAKSESKGRVVYYDKDTENRRKRILSIWRMFPEALEKQEFKAYYQPKVDVVSGEIVGAEALCRWIRNGEVIPPIDFIPLLEQNTDICTLDFYMLDIVCKDIRRWMDDGRKPVRISVNLSRKHLIDTNLLESIMKIIDDNRVPHKYVEIELTETINDIEFRDLKRVVTGLKDEGVCTAVDDFGMGYSSLNLIKEIPWDVIKIDKSFLPTDGDKDSDMMYKHVVAIAHELGLECVTEGVETYGQLGILRDNKCRIAQGFYFDKPLPVEEFEKRLEKAGYDIEDDK